VISDAILLVLMVAAWIALFFAAYTLLVWL
jgi:hypothetical protein